ncbi:MAG: hypothetical protein FJW27_10050 [Acidimicrobiia bacterium]|nr:hypothetical protein [Acidimicrobiia bacterium]
MIDLRTLLRDALASAALFADGALLSFGVSSPAAGLIAFWLPSGISLALLARSDTDRWGGIVAGALTASVGVDLLAAQRGLLPALGFAAASTCEALAGAFLLRISGGLPSPHRVIDMLRLVAVGALVSAIPGALIGTLGMTTQHGDLTTSWVRWLVADMTGIIVVAPLLLVSRDEWRRSATRLRGWLGIELLLAFGTLVALSLAVFWLPPHPIRKMFLVLPWILWVMFRFGATELLVAIFAIVALGVRGTMVGLGPFGGLPTADASFFM